ncbi:EF-hand domain-containing family member C2-like [Xenia sp. Carnegie-2017]|uniref:EF-hand domain-containing family member C2-like n=1 Tax=Xenia sp. Carnegie-2017 TaxID=2897299 RepID=UPI001F049A3E|nr:EF-hand domain-containing family member C2-like [Xenia sp. Carnegie-2017]
MSLPFLPGQVFDRKLGKTKFHKSQLFDYKNDVRCFVGGAKSGIGGEILPGRTLPPGHSTYPKGVGPEAPSWVAFDRQVLCFDAYFQEAVHEKREEQYRIRKCKIYFYLEDDGIQVNEQKVDNSGIPQGTLIRRHRVPLPVPNDDYFYTVDHFNIGREVNIYSKVFKIIDCDEFTRNFLTKLGVRVGKPEKFPDDPYSLHRCEMKESMQPLRPYEKQDTLKQFLQYDRRVLRFYCLWDDTDSMFGDPREMVLHYFLADDTIEIREIIRANSGRDAVPMFLRRQRLPKEPISTLQPGRMTGRTVLNVFGPTGHGGRWILDSLKTGAVHINYYTDADLTIGSVINVWGRRFFIFDCDENTKEHYQTKFGIDNFQPIKHKSDPEQPIPREIPPYNGFGSEEDSLCSCLSLIPKPPKRDFMKFMEKDRHGLNSNVLRFMAKMDSGRPNDESRYFIISYFLCDDTIVVFEPTQQNSGIIGGKFMERNRIKLPDGSGYYSSQDLYIGAHVEFLKHKFILTDADEYAVYYIEKNNKEYLQANVPIILSKLREITDKHQDKLRSYFAEVDTQDSGYVSFDDFRNIVMKYSSNISVHEILSVCRHYGSKKAEEDNYDALISAIQEKLRKTNYENFENLYDACRHRDIDQTGYIDMMDLHNVARSFKIPAKQELLDAVLMRMKRNTNGQVSYKEYIDAINWRDHPVQLQRYIPVSVAETKAKERVRPMEGVIAVNYKALMKDLLLQD